MKVDLHSMSELYNTTEKFSNLTMARFGHIDSYEYNESDLFDSAKSDTGSIVVKIEENQLKYLEVNELFSQKLLFVLILNVSLNVLSGWNSS